MQIRANLFFNSQKHKSLFQKKYQKKHLWHLDRNCCYFCKSNISVINLILSSRNIIKIQQNTTASTETFTENSLRRSFALHSTSYLSIALFKILPHSKTIKNAKKLLVFGENVSRRLSKYFQIHIFWNFDHISRSCSQIN